MSNRCHSQCGCEASSCCLECPLSQCKLEVEGGLPVVRERDRTAEIERMYEEGLRPAEIAEHFGLSVRSVYRRNDRAFARLSRDKRRANVGA